MGWPRRRCRAGSGRSETGRWCWCWCRRRRRRRCRGRRSRGGTPRRRTTPRCSWSGRPRDDDDVGADGRDRRPSRPRPPLRAPASGASDGSFHPRADDPRRGVLALVDRPAPGRRGRTSRRFAMRTPSRPIPTRRRPRRGPGPGGSAWRAAPSNPRVDTPRANPNLSRSDAVDRPALARVVGRFPVKSEMLTTHLLRSFPSPNRRPNATSCAPPRCVSTAQRRDEGDPSKT